MGDRELGGGEGGREMQCRERMNRLRESVGELLEKGRE